MRPNRRAVLELVLAVAAAAGAVASWFGAQTLVTVAPVVPGEPQTTSVVYSPPMLVLALVLATAAGVLAVVGIARLRRLRPAPGHPAPGHPAR